MLLPCSKQGLSARLIDKNPSADPFRHSQWRKPKRLGSCPTLPWRDSLPYRVRMPTIFKIGGNGGWQVRVIPGDHRPAHVHVIKAPSEAVFNLNCPDGPVELRESYNCPHHVLNWLEHELNSRLTDGCDGWRTYANQP